MKLNNKSYNIPGSLLKYFILLLFFNTIPWYWISAAISKKDSLNKVAETYRVTALRYDRNKDVYNAIEYYNKYLFLKSKDIKLTYRLASLYFNTRDYQHANQYFDSVILSKNKKYPLSFYYKGIVCMNLEKYDDAIAAFTKFRKIYKEDEDPDYRKMAAIYTESSEWAKGHQETDGGYTIMHPREGINHAGIDFSPYQPDDNTLLYGAVYVDPSGHSQPVRQIFKAIKANDQWKNQGLLEGEVNDPAFNTGNPAVSEDGKRMYFTRMRKNWQNVNVCEIYMSRFDGEKWQTPEKLPFPVNNENYTSTQPAVGKNLKTGNDILYFVSDRPDGKGGLDIWYTELNPKTGAYKEPQDLDKGVNSPGDECSPFYDFSTRTLYFSSKGRKNGFGGYDIYKATGSAKKWSETVPMPKPVNSSSDDYYFSISKDNKEGFFTSNRPGALSYGNGSCCDDIFSFKMNECTKVYSWGTVKNSVNLDFYDHLNEKYHLGLTYPENNSLLPDVPVELYLSGEKEGDEILLSKTTTNEKGIFSFELEKNKQYKVLVKNYGYFEKKRTISTVGVPCSDTLKIGTTLISYLPRVNVRINIYYDHDKYKLSDEARQTIDTTLMPLFDLFPNAIIEIGSHTDSTGTDAYNLKLSQKRSESVVSYLISKGISSERLVPKGYGMQFPIAPNSNPDGTENPAGMKLNRRTEIKIVGEINTPGFDE